MKPRHTQKIFMRHIINYKTKEIGYIHLVSYLLQCKLPHIEFHLEKEFRNKGIMSLEIKKYLKKCKKYDIGRILAVIKSGNIPSERIVKKNDFIFIGKVNEKLNAYAHDFILN